MKNKDFHDEQGNFLQNKDDEINAGEDKLLIDDTMNCNEGILMVMKLSYFKDIN